MMRLPSRTRRRRSASRVDVATTLTDGPWQHRFVSAGGARFHVAEAGTGPMVLLLHGFPQFWWSWRHQLPALAAAGYRVVAMDLRGYGASDKPPRGYDTPSLVADVANVIRSLGEDRAVIVGQDVGGQLAWAAPTLAPESTRAIAVLGAAHPRLVLGSLTRSTGRHGGRGLVAAQLPFVPERRLTAPDGATVEAVLREGGGPGWPTPQVLQHYVDAMRVPFVAHCATEHHRWQVRSLPRRDGRSFRRRMRTPITIPVLHLHGDLDAVVPAELSRRSSRWTRGNYRWETVTGAGHHLPEEAPDVVNGVLVDWLSTLPD